MRKTTILQVLLVFTLTLGAAALADVPASVAPRVRPTRDIDLVICLDTSGSMNGLIASAKQKLWAIVNELALARPRPNLRVGLYHYGNDGLDAETGWVKQLCPLTSDLDEVYGKLFELKTNGGTEYVARVVRAATEQLAWSGQKNALRIIVVAGNEPATQDEKTNPLESVCKAAAGKGIIINTIFCGAEAEGRNTGWADAARWADGRYAAIDQQGGTVVIQTPYDAKIAELGTELNKTYVAYGARGKAGQAAQRAQDANAASVNAPAAAQRAVAKAGGLYRNAGWDLVDAVAEKRVDLATVDTEDLPAEMQDMTPEQRKEHIAQLAAQRAEVQKQIHDLNAKREAYVRAEMEKKGLGEGSAFDAALRTAVREQAAGKDFHFEEGK